MPYPSTVAVSPPGGPQPAQKQTSNGDFTSTDLLASLFTGLGASGGSGAITQLPSFPADWKPTPEALGAYIKGDQNTATPTYSDSLWGRIQAAGGLTGPGRFLTGQTPGPPSTNGFANNISNSPNALKELLASVKTPADLAKKIGVSPQDLQGVIADSWAPAASQIAANNAAGAKAKGGPNSGSTASADSIDRAGATGTGGAADPSSFLTPNPLSSDELTQLALQMHAHAALDAPVQLENAKQQILADTAAAMDRTRQINEVYQAGLQGRPLPTASAPTQSSAQSRYGTAPDITPVAAPFNPQLATLDPNMADNAITAAAALVEKKRTVEAAYRATQQARILVAQRKSQEAALGAVQKSADKRAAAAAAKDSIANQEAEVTKVWSTKLASHAVTVAVNDPTNPYQDAKAARSKYNELVSAFDAGLHFNDAVEHVYGVGTSPSSLSRGDLKLIQAAQVATGKIPPELKHEHDQQIAKLHSWLLAQRGIR